MAVLELSDITKRFGSLAANDGISLSLAAGEVLALLGENGAGKTTLMNILFGHYVADQGTVRVNGEILPPGSTDAAIAAGIGMVHQHFTLADNLSVLDNVMLGTENLWSLRQNRLAARTKLRKMSADFGLAVDPDALVGDISVGERQPVEILKVLYRDARVLILDEPTAMLTPQEAQRLFSALRSLTDTGLSVIFISHKLHEILAISDRVAVLRRGAIVGTVETANAGRAQLAEMMVGRAVQRPQHAAMPPGRPILELNDIVLRSAAGRTLLDGVDLTVRAHEIVGIAGVAGNGQSGLASMLSGLAPPHSGTLTLNGVDVSSFSPRRMVRAGVGRIPEDRHASGVVGEMDLWENLISEDLRSSQVSRWNWIIDKRRALERARGQIKDYDVRCEGPLAQTKLLSGGNMQKLILARALSQAPIFIVANQPVRGLDEGAIAYVQTQILDARARGAGILLISEDLDELLGLSDRIAVIFQGRLSRTFAPDERTIQQIGLMMAGQSSSPVGGEAGSPVHAN